MTTSNHIPTNNYSKFSLINQNAEGSTQNHRVSIAINYNPLNTTLFDNFFTKSTLPNQAYHEGICYYAFRKTRR